MHNFKHTRLALTHWAFQYTTQEFCQSTKENERVGKWGGGLS